MTASDTFKLFILRHGQSELNHENIFCGWIDAKLTEKGKAQARNAAQLIKEYARSNALPIPQIAYTSRLARTKQTTEVMLQEFGLVGDYHIVTGCSDIPALTRPTASRHVPVLQTWRLNERHYGSWQGQRKPNVLKEYGKEQYMFIRRDYQGKPPSADLSREMEQEENDQGPLTGYDFKEPNRHVKYGREEAHGEPLPNSESLHDVVRRLQPFLEGVILEDLQERQSSLIVGHGSSVRSILKILEGISDEAIKDVDIPNAIPLVVELDRSTGRFVRKLYLDPESAKVNAARVRNEGFEKL